MLAAAAWPAPGAAARRPPPARRHALHAPLPPLPHAGVYIADALSMPVHWYYDPKVLQRDFGRITKYEAPKEKHPGSIM